MKGRQTARYSIGFFKTAFCSLPRSNCSSWNATLWQRCPPEPVLQTYTTHPTRRTGTNFGARLQPIGTMVTLRLDLLVASLGGDSGENQYINFYFKISSYVSILKHITEPPVVRWLRFSDQRIQDLGFVSGTLDEAIDLLLHDVPARVSGTKQ